MLVTQCGFDHVMQPKVTQQQTVCLIRLLNEPKKPVAKQVYMLIVYKENKLMIAISEKYSPIS